MEEIKKRISKKKISSISTRIKTEKTKFIHKIPPFIVVASFLFFPFSMAHNQQKESVRFPHKFPKRPEHITKKKLWDDYLNAIKDAEIANSDEISKDLMAIVESNKKLVWKKEGSKKKVLVVTWTSWSGYFNWIGQPMTTTRDIWITVVPDLKEFCKNQHRHPRNLSLRLEQLLGLPPNNGKQWFVEIWVDPDDLFRPSPDPEITDYESELDFPRPQKLLTISPSHIDWINDLKSKMYGEDGYPWTRLGYTYDWGNPFSEIGLSEFVISKGAVIEIHSISYTIDYCY